MPLKNNIIKYGIFLGRFQPFHLGHQHAFDKIRKDGLIPIAIKGSAQEFGTEKNPYHPLVVEHMLKLANNDMCVLHLEDAKCWDEWLTKLKWAIRNGITEDLSEVTIYLHEKLEDLQNFTFRGKDYTNESYCKMYEVEGLNTVTMPISDIDIRAKSIRNDLENNRQYLHPKVYEYIKGINL